MPKYTNLQYMEKLSNTLQTLLWNFRHRLNLPQKTVAPLIWHPVAITPNHLPSQNFRGSKNPLEIEKIDKIVRELELFSKLSLRFPKKLTDSDWTTLLELKTRKNRYDQLLFLYKKEVLAAEDRRKKLEARREKTTPQPVDTPTLLRPSTTTEEWVKMRNLVHHHTFSTASSPILAVDCQFLPDLSPRGRGLTALQLQYLATENRKNSHPFRLFFINYQRENPKIRELEETKLQWLQNSDGISAIVSENGVRETFKDAKEVIYLSPDATEELESVEDGNVYVIGGIVDRVPEHGIPKQASLEAAQKAGVLARKLPIDRYVEFKSGSRFLTLLAVADCLREVNLHGDWQKALEKTIPVRNTRGVDEKNPKARAAKQRIHEFNMQVLKRVDRILGKENF